MNKNNIPCPLPAERIAVLPKTPKDSRKGYSQVVSRTLDKGGDKPLILRLDGDKILKLRRFAPVSKHDRVRVAGGGAWVRLRKMPGEIRVKPAWSHQEFLHINGKKISLTVKEIETNEELEGYHALTQFHYRGQGGVGRRIPLIAKVSRWNLPPVVGFVELSSSLLVNVARKRVLNAPFRDKDLGFRWERWDMDTAKKYNNALARISRCVIYPELRGLGLAPKLVNAAVNYARERWHIGGLRPCFIEIVAEMLRYWPFVEKCGFVKVGETEGNDKRAPQAMAYLLSRKSNGQGYPQGGGGIMSMHRKHANRIAEMCKQENRSVASIVKLLSSSFGEMSRKDWVALHDLCRRKKPTYMFGLTDAAKRHLSEKKIEAAGPPLPKKRQGILAKIQEMCVVARAVPSDSSRCRQIQEAFGIVSAQLELNLIKDFSAEFSAGEIILVTGVSGAGKSLFVEGVRRLIEKKEKSGFSKNIDIRGTCEIGGNPLRIKTLKLPPGGKSPIDLFGKNYPLDEAMQILALAGLAEPHIFVRPARSLSEGQRYRLALAAALAKKPDIILVDAFCESLDEYTAASVCRKLRRAADMEGICILAATADARRVSAELRPNRTLLLSSGGSHKWINRRRG